jgi:hypothetical protein
MKEWIKKTFSFLTPKKEVSEQELNAIKSLLKNSFVVLKKYQESNEDNNVSAMEWLGVIKSARPIVSNIYNWRAIKDQILNFKYDDGKDLVLFVISQGVFPDKAEEVVKHLVAYVELQIFGYTEHVKPVIALFKK